MSERSSELYGRQVSELTFTARQSDKYYFRGKNTVIDSKR